VSIVDGESALVSSTAVDVDLGQQLLSDSSVGPIDTPVSPQSTHHVYTVPLPHKEVCRC